MLLPWPLDPAALRLCVSAALPSRQRMFGFFRDLGQQYDMVSRVAVKFSYLSTQTIFSVSHSAWYALFPSRSTLVIPPVGSLVWARTPSLFLVLCYAGLLPALYCRLIAMAFWGP
jgi:hypothetical protein